MSNADTLQGFIFHELAIRGQVAGLQQCYQDALAGHAYPVGVARLLGEAMAAAALLSSNLKFAGTLSIQAQGDGPLNLLLAECRHNRELRAVARWVEEDVWDDLEGALGHGILAITIEPDRGQRYQGIVPLEQGSLAICLEEYFAQSEQLNTRIWLTSDGNSASGLMVQALPNAGVASDEGAAAWDRISLLTSTLTPAELSALDNETLLYRLYHEERVSVFPAAELLYACRCSRARFSKAIRALGRDEIEDILEEQGAIVTHCEFCNREYRYTAQDLQLQQGDDPDSKPPPPPTLH